MNIFTKISNENKKNITILNSNMCTGCGMCSNICPNSAITMEFNDEGFIYPKVNEKCTLCGLCANKCPQLHETGILHSQNNCFAIQCYDEARKLGSSGGVFGIIAKKILANNGFVCGAAFNDDCSRVNHIIVDNVDNLEKIFKSKYIQSNTNDIYMNIKKLLDQNRWVLFSGCPCQVDALYSFLGKDYNTLITIDILCHGVPSPFAYKKFLEEVSNGRKVIAVDFRDKKFGWGTLINIKFSDKSAHYDYYDGNYFKAFLSGLSMRKSCYQCKYAMDSRVGDITLGDFWGIKAYNETFDDGKGTSLVLCNTNKGLNIIKTLKNEFKLFEHVPYSKCVEISKKSNAALVRPTTEPKMRSCFFRHLKSGDTFSKSLRYAQTSLIDVGILGWWIETPRSNYGSTLTNYALYNYLQSLGLSVAMVSPPNFDRHYAGEFNKKYGYRMTAKYAPEDMKENNKYIDTFIVASDVLWYYDAFIKTGYFFMLDFVDDDKRKISYATSFGNTNRFFPENDIIKARALLNRFDSISVREYEAVDICKSRFGIQATQVLDPVFICDKKCYDILAANATRKTSEKFMLSYILDPTEQKVEVLDKISKKLHLKLVTITDKQFNATEKYSLLKGHGLIENATIEELIYHFMNSSFVVTDSYHGLCFSLIFERTFVTLVNRARGASRFETLANDFNIWDRMVDSIDIILNKTDLLKPIEYSKIRNKIQMEISRSKKWLNDAIFAPKNKISTQYDEVLLEIFKLKNELDFVKQKLNAIEKNNNLKK